MSSSHLLLELDDAPLVHVEPDHFGPRGTPAATAPPQAPGARVHAALQAYNLRQKTPELDTHIGRGGEEPQ